jgi:hypothetical protein
MPAKPFGAFSLVEPWMTSRNMKVKTTSAMNADTSENPPERHYHNRSNRDRKLLGRSWDFQAQSCRELLYQSQLPRIGRLSRRQCLSFPFCQQQASIWTPQGLCGNQKCFRWHTPWPVQRPKAKDIPARPMPRRPISELASTALPQPTKTITNVPISSARYFFTSTFPLI